MNYREKYLKYKMKYLNLKKYQKGGVINENSVRADVLAAVQENGLALEFASVTLKNDKKVVREAVQENGLALEFASVTLKNDIKVVLAAVQQNGKAIKFASDKLKSSNRVVINAVGGNESNKEIMMEVVKNNGQALNYADDSLKADYDVVKAAVQQNGQALKYADDSLKADYDVVKAAVQQNGKAIQFASDNLKENYSLISIALKTWTSGENEYIKKLVKSKKCNLDICNNVGGRCYYMSVIMLLNNINSKVLHKEGLEESFEFANDLVSKCSILSTIDYDRMICEPLPTNIQKIYDSYLQKYEIPRERSTQVIETGNAYELLIAFLSASEYSSLNWVTDIDSPDLVTYDTLVTEDINAIHDDRLEYFNCFKYNLKFYITNKIEDSDNIYNFNFCIDFIIHYYNTLKREFEHKKLLGGTLSLTDLGEYGHAISWYICEIDENNFTIIICDPNSTTNCEIVYNTISKKRTLYPNNVGWDKIYFEHIVCLLINTEFNPQTAVATVLQSNTGSSNETFKIYK